MKPTGMTAALAVVVSMCSVKAGATALTWTDTLNLGVPGTANAVSIANVSQGNPRRDASVFPIAQPLLHFAMTSSSYSAFGLRQYKTPTFDNTAAPGLDADAACVSCALPGAFDATVDNYIGPRAGLFRLYGDRGPAGRESGIGSSWTADARASYGGADFYGPVPSQEYAVPDGGSTAALLGAALVAFVFVHRRVSGG